MRSASLDKIPKWTVASDFDNGRTKYLNMLEGNENKIKSAKLQQEDKKAYLMINEIYTTGGYYEENYSDKSNNVKNASVKKRDPTAFIITGDYTKNKAQYHAKAEVERQEQEQQKVKSASKKRSSNKPSYLVTRDYLFKGETD